MEISWKYSMCINLFLCFEVPLSPENKESNIFINYKEFFTISVSFDRKSGEHKYFHKVLTMVPMMNLKCFVCGWTICMKTQNFKEPKKHKNSSMIALISKEKSLICVFIYSGENYEVKILELYNL